MIEILKVFKERKPLIPSFTQLYWVYKYIIYILAEIFNAGMNEFCEYCTKTKVLPTDLHIVIFDITQKIGQYHSFQQ